VAEFFSVKKSGMMNSDLVQQPIGGVYEPISGSIDGDTTSSIVNYQSFNNNAYNYTESSMYLHFINLVERGDLKLEFEVPKVTNPHFNTMSYTYTLTSELGSKEKLSTSKGTPDGAINNEKGNILIVKSDKENVYNVFTNLSATGTPVTTTTYDLNKESFSKIELVDEKGGKSSLSLTFEKNGFIDKELKLPTEKSFEVVERLVLAYRDTYIKNYMEYLPDFAQLKYFLTQNMEDVFGKYEPKVMLPPKGVDEELVKGEVSDFEKLRSKFTYFTNDIINSLSILFYGNLSKSQRISNIERYRKNISIAVLNLGKQNDNSKNILKTYGESNLIVVKNELNSLNKENDDIDKKIEVLQTEKTTISEVEVERKEQTVDLEEILGGVDTTFIDKQGLSEGSIISAKSAHTETLKIYAGQRINKIINETISKGAFEVEVFELTDIEAKLLLEAGYYIKETTEPIKKGNTIVQKISWTINWESANSILDPREEPIGPILTPAE